MAEVLGGSRAIVAFTVDIEDRAPIPRYRQAGAPAGLCRALADKAAQPHKLADRIGTDSRYVEEWLRGQAASGYLEYDADSGTYSMTEEQAFALTNPEEAVYAPGAFQLALGALAAVRVWRADAGHPGADVPLA